MESGEGDVEDVHVCERLLMSGSSSSVNDECSSPTQRGVSPSSVVNVVLYCTVVLYFTVVMSLKWIVVQRM